MKTGKVVWWLKVIEYIITALIGFLGGATAACTGAQF